MGSERQKPAHIINKLGVEKNGSASPAESTPGWAFTMVVKRLWPPVLGTLHCSSSCEDRPIGGAIVLRGSDSRARTPCCCPAGSWGAGSASWLRLGGLGEAYRERILFASKPPAPALRGGWTNHDGTRPWPGRVPLATRASDFRAGLGACVFDGPRRLGHSVPDRTTQSLPCSDPCDHDQGEKQGVLHRGET